MQHPIAPNTMIIDYKTIELFGQTLFTWITVKTPMKETFPMPDNEACFAYILDVQNQPLHTAESILAHPGQVVLSKCGHYVSAQIRGSLEPKTIELPEGKVSSLIVHFNKKTLRELYGRDFPPFVQDLRQPCTHHMVQMAASKLIKNYFESVATHFEFKETISEAILIIKLKEILFILSKTKNSEEISTILSSIFSERTFTFKEIIEANLHRVKRVEDLAMLCNLSLSSFKRAFKKNYQMTPGHFLVVKKLEKVAQMLELSDENITSIGYQCGFSSPSNLSKVFKAKYGKSPKQYKKDLINK